jgi:hypothetical protein
MRLPSGLASAVCALLVALGLQGSAQERPDNARVRALNARLLDALGQVERRQDGRAEGAAVIEERARALAALASDDPEGALRLALSPDLSNRIARAFPAAAAQLETHGTWDGPLEYIVEDSLDFATHRNVRSIVAGGERLAVEFAGPEPPGLKKGDLVRPTGMRVGNVLAVSDGSIIAPALDGPLTCSTTGVQRSIVLMVTMPGFPPPANITANDVHDPFFSPS